MKTRIYQALDKQVLSRDGYSLVPIRYEDRYDIMKWRNEQMYHLRQSEPLTKEKQDAYFENVVAELFNQEQPDQILFSFLEAEVCVGYGGLVHINWPDQHAEISFIMNTELEEDYFSEYWSKYLPLIEEVAFSDLVLHKIYTYAFDIRPHLYPVLVNSGFRKEAVLKEHSIFKGNYKDVLIHTKYNRQIRLREVTSDDLEVTFKWATDSEVRKYSINKSQITLEEHKQWFMNKLNQENCLFAIAEYNQRVVGSFRLDIDKQGIGRISYLLDSDYHGLGLGMTLLEEGVAYVKERKQVKVIIGDVMEGNQASIKIFEKMGFCRINEKNNLIKFQLRTS